MYKTFAIKNYVLLLFFILSCISYMLSNLKIEKGFRENEVKCLLLLEHPSIPKLFGYIKGKGYSEIFMEYTGQTFKTLTGTLHRF